MIVFGGFSLFLHKIMLLVPLESTTEAITKRKHIIISMNYCLNTEKEHADLPFMKYVY